MFPERYSVSNAKRVLRNPALLRRELRTVARPLLGRYNATVGRRVFESKYGSGTDLIERDWDTLIILDACRHDIFREHNTIDGELSSVVSNASHSEEFVNKSINGKSLHDTVYVTANPFAEDVEHGVFHKVTKTYSSEVSCLERSERRTPERVYEVAREEHERFPDKRLVVHFMQPHEPYYGATAEQLRDELSREKELTFLSWSDRDSIEDPTAAHICKNLLRAASRGLISDRQLRDVYVENLELVLEYVEQLLDVLDGKSVITADHGELLGAPGSRLLPKRYQHGRGIYCPELRLVPWLEVENGPRRQTVAETPVEEPTEVDDTAVDEQLRALGYVE